MSLLQVADLTVGLPASKGKSPPVLLLDHVSLRVDAGCTTVVLGQSGCGKSMLCQAVLGLLPRGIAALGGTVSFCDPQTPSRVHDLTPPAAPSPGYKALRGSRIATIFQDPAQALSPVHTIANQIAEMGRVHLALSHPEARDKAEAMLERVGFEDPLRIMASLPGELSGGMRQRAMIALALVTEPALLLADEPTASLDVTTRARIVDLLHGLADSMKLGVLLVTHDLTLAAAMGDTLALMAQGRILERGPAAQVLEDPAHPESQTLLGAAPWSPARGTQGSPSLALETGANAPAAPRLRVDSLSASHAPPKGKEQGADTLSNVGFEIPAGTCLGIVGPSGSGKSTLARAIAGAVPVRTGQIAFCPRSSDRPVDLLGTHADAHQALQLRRRRIHYLFQDASLALNPRHRVGDILAEPLVVHGLCASAERADRVGWALAQVGLDPACAGRYPHAFSGGQRQRIGIARALMSDPDLLLLDEPTSALDPVSQDQILSLLTDLRQRLGLTYLFISHDLGVIARMAERIGVLAHGRLVELGRAEAILSAPAHPATKALVDAVAPRDRNAGGLRIDDPGLACPSDWPSPFRLEPGAQTTRRAIAREHWVLTADP